MRDNFDKSLALVLASEGGFCDRLADRGGATNKGITLANLKDFFKDFDYGDFDGDGDIDIDDIRRLNTPGKASPIYRVWFWEPPKCDELPAGVDYLIFDAAVNHGPANAGKFLQRALNRTARVPLLVDGCIGSKTLEAVPTIDTGALIADVLRERDIFYRKIVANDHTQEIFFKGWMNRLAAVTVNVKGFV